MLREVLSAFLSFGKIYRLAVAPAVASFVTYQSAKLLAGIDTPALESTSVVLAVVFGKIYPWAVAPAVASFATSQLAKSLAGVDTPALEGASVALAIGLRIAVLVACHCPYDRILPFGGRLDVVK